MLQCAAHRGVGRVAGGGGEARGGWSLLGDVRRICMSAGVFFQTVGGQYQQALGMYEFTLVCALALEGRDSPSVAACHVNTGNLLRAMGKHEEALVRLQKGLDVLVAVHGHEHPSMAASYTNISVVLQNMGKYQEAIDMELKSLEIEIRVHGDSHPLVADSFNNLGTVYGRKGGLENADGQEHPLVASSFNNLGSLYGRKGDFENALVHFQKALDVFLAAVLVAVRHLWRAVSPLLIT